MTRTVPVSALDELPAAVASLARPGGRPVLVLVGGAGGMTPEQEAVVRVLLAERIVPVLTDTGAAVVDGGTDAGIMRAVGAVHRDVGGTFALVGVVARGTAAMPEDGEAAPGTAALNRNHDVILLVPGDTWGDESRWLEEVATVLAQGRPSVTLLVNGGDIALRDVRRSVDRGRPVLVVAGTGRLADDVATADDGSPDAVRQVAASPLTRTVHLDEGDGGVLATALRRHLDPGHGTTGGDP